MESAVAPLAAFAAISALFAKNPLLFTASRDWFNAIREHVYSPASAAALSKSRRDRK